MPFAPGDSRVHVWILAGGTRALCNSIKHFLTAGALTGYDTRLCVRFY